MKAYPFWFGISFFSVLLADPACALRKSKPGWNAVLDWSAGQPFDTSEWTFEAGFLRNEEQQYYAGQSNFSVSDAGIPLTARKERVDNPDYRKGALNWRQARAEAKYTSASIVSKKARQNLRIEIVAAVQGGKGAWPAIWLRGANARGFGEVDLMEQLGREPDLVHATVHFGSSFINRTAKTAERTIPGLQGREVLYEAELTPDLLALSVDGQPMLTMDRNTGSGRIQPLQQPFNLVINLALGSAWAGPVDEEALPATMTIKSLRISEWQGQQPVNKTAEKARSGKNGAVIVAD
ncbi:glycoside hydrolase family 16 protein [Hyphomicrobium sp.]|uniref:glycoside hydrolase family 16 protein n=1 Tax=Hyphomicrobium sp. TaxID=82 RepID=UPI002D77D1FC|nr:glycoside hydrolase family 16 protein [Hyphomicrobium sp.]HET6388049.1 glycoside hydrolase family 16 protein [Hyphomicrobium sp.]